MKKREIMIGQIIWDFVKEKKINVETFANAIGYPRQQVYSAVFHKNSLDYGLLRKISDVLGYDFQLEYSEDKKVSEKYLLYIETEKPVDLEEMIKTLSSKVSITVLSKTLIEGV